MDGDKILSKLRCELRRKNVQVLLVNVGRDNLELLRKTGTLEQTVSQNIYRTVLAAVSAAQKDPSPAAAATWAGPGRG